MKILIIWTELNGYITACLREFLSECDVEILVISNIGNNSQSNIAPYDKKIFDGLQRIIEVREKSSLNRYHQIVEEIKKFKPGLILFTFQWRYLETYRIINYAKRKKVKIIGMMDNSWSSSFKQLLFSSMIKGLNLLPLDGVWVPGERAVQYAKRLFRGDVKIFRGLYCANDEIFNIGKNQDKERLLEREEHKFIFIGRLVKEKGIQELICAYKKYRFQNPDPWDLIIIGNGPLEKFLINIEGVIHFNFIQQWDLPKFLRPEYVFVLPSLFEPWGVVIHEATLMGLPIICSDACGASVELVQDGVNGYVYRSGDADMLAYSFRQIAQNSQMHVFGQMSYQFSKRYSRKIWANTLKKIIMQFVDD